jgi:hypothetical protein
MTVIHNELGAREEAARNQSPHSLIGAAAHEGIEGGADPETAPGRTMAAARKIAPRFACRLRNRLKKI